MCKQYATLWTICDVNNCQNITFCRFWECSCSINKWDRNILWCDMRKVQLLFKQTQMYKWVNKLQIWTDIQRPYFGIDHFKYLMLKWLIVVLCPVLWILKKKLKVTKLGLYFIFIHCVWKAAQKHNHESFSNHNS